MTKYIKVYGIINIGVEFMKCIFFNSDHVNKHGNHNGYQRYDCLDCKKRFDGEKYTTVILNILV